VGKKRKGDNNSAREGREEGEQTFISQIDPEEERKIITVGEQRGLLLHYQIA